MKHISIYKSAKYKEESYQAVGKGIYLNDEVFVVSLSFQQEPELDEGKDSSNISQYPLEDVLDRFGVYISDFYKEINSKGKAECILEFASEDKKDIEQLLKIVGKHVYNKLITEDGEDAAALIIE